MPRTGRSSVDRALTRPEREKLMAYIRTKGNEKDLLAYYCLTEFGLRVSEYSHLRESWLDIDRGTIRIPARQECGCAECVEKRKGFWYPKTKAAIRTIPAKKIAEKLDSRGWEVLTKYFALGGSVPADRKRIWNRIRELGRLAGIQKEIFPHALRSTAALQISSIPNMTAAGLMAILGWTRLETANRYVAASGVELDRIFEGGA